MKTNMKRRVFLKGTLGGVGVAVGAGLLAPQMVLAAWNKDAFEAKAADVALKAAMGSATSDATADIKIKAPDIAENGAVVPVTVKTSLGSIESVALMADKNASPMAAIFTLGASTQGDISTRIKMGQTGDVIAVVKAGGKLYSARKSVKVTIGGCGG